MGPRLAWESSLARHPVAIGRQKMTPTWRRIATMQRTKSASAIVGGAAAIALVASALAVMGPDDSASASKGHAGKDNAEYSSPSETPMLLGATTSVPEAPGTAPAIARAEPAIKGHH